MAELEGGFSAGCHQRGCKAVPEAELQKALSALLMCQEHGAYCRSKTDSGCDVEESEFCSIHGLGSKVLGIRSARANAHKKFQGEWFRSDAVGMAVVILLYFLLLMLALGVALAVLAAEPHVPVTPATPQCCPSDWVGYKGVCYYFSRDYSTWEQGQERCSKMNASLAIAKDEEAMDLLLRLHWNGDFWLGLRRRGERLHWGDGSSYSSRVPVFGNSQCVYLAENRLKSDNCSSERPYVCSKAQAPP